MRENHSKMGRQLGITLFTEDPSKALCEKKSSLDRNGEEVVLLYWKITSHETRERGKGGGRDRRREEREGERRERKDSVVVTFSVAVIKHFDKII